MESEVSIQVRLKCLKAGVCMQGKYGLPPVFIKFYWNTSRPICLHVIYGCFCKTQWQSWVVATETVRSAEYKTFVIWSGPLRKSLLTSGLGNSYFSGLNPEMRNTNPGVVISLGNYLSHFTFDCFFSFTTQQVIGIGNLWTRHYSNGFTFSKWTTNSFI